MMTPRFKGKPNFDLFQPCPMCGYKIQPNELVRLASHVIKCPKCGDVFNEMGNRKPLSKSWPNLHASEIKAEINVIVDSMPTTTQVHVDEPIPEGRCSTPGSSVQASMKLCRWGL
jgi:hypothetical protein